MNDVLEKFQDEILTWNKISAGGEHVYSKEKVLLYFKLLNDEIIEYLEVKDDKSEETAKEIADIFFVAIYLDHLVKNVDGLPQQVIDNTINSLERALHLVEEADTWAFMEMNISQVIWSNFSKFPSQEEMNPDVQATWIENNSEGRYEGVTYARIMDYFVFKDSNGKVLKPSIYRDPIIHLR